MTEGEVSDERSRLVQWYTGRAVLCGVDADQIVSFTWRLGEPVTVTLVDGTTRSIPLPWSEAVRVDTNYTHVLP